MVTNLKYCYNKSNSKIMKCHTFGTCFTSIRSVGSNGIETGCIIKDIHTPNHGEAAATRTSVGVLNTISNHKSGNKANNSAFSSNNTLW